MVEILVLAEVCTLRAQSCCRCHDYRYHHHRYYYTFLSHGVPGEAVDREGWSEIVSVAILLGLQLDCASILLGSALYLPSASVSFFIIIIIT